MQIVDLTKSQELVFHEAVERFYDCEDTETDQSKNIHNLINNQIQDAFGKHSNGNHSNNGASSNGVDEQHQTENDLQSSSVQDVQGKSNERQTQQQFSNKQDMGYQEQATQQPQQQTSQQQTRQQQQVTKQQKEQQQQQELQILNSLQQQYFRAYQIEKDKEKAKGGLLSYFMRRPSVKASQNDQQQQENQNMEAQYQNEFSLEKVSGSSSGSWISLQHDKVFGIPWQKKANQLKIDSPFRNLKGWNMKGVIVKSGEDSRQELLAMLLIEVFAEIFSSSNFPQAMVRPYTIVITSNQSSIMEFLSDCMSVHTIKQKLNPGETLADYFFSRFPKNTPQCLRAQRLFAESMAGYSLVSYFLRIKDRHNGNIMMDINGRVVHIDYDFMLSNSPGGVDFEAAPFKLTKEYLDIMEYDAFKSSTKVPPPAPPSRPGSGPNPTSAPASRFSLARHTQPEPSKTQSPTVAAIQQHNYQQQQLQLQQQQSEIFNYFKSLFVKGFLACRKNHLKIISLVQIMSGTGFPCFNKGPEATVQSLSERFMLRLSEEECTVKAVEIIAMSIDDWRTRQYDYYQKVLNGIM